MEVAIKLQNGKLARNKNPLKMGKKKKLASGLKYGIWTISCQPSSCWRPIFGYSGLGPFSILFPICVGFLLRPGFLFCTWPLPLQILLSQALHFCKPIHGPTHSWCGWHGRVFAEGVASHLPSLQKLYPNKFPDLRCCFPGKPVKNNERSGEERVHNVFGAPSESAFHRCNLSGPVRDTPPISRNTLSR